MDLGFISKYNIDNIFDNINAYIVKKHNYNLDSNKKYRKIIKKLSKTVFSSLNNSSNDRKKNIMINDFNSIVLTKSMPFLIKEIEKDSEDEKLIPIKPILKKTEPVGADSPILSSHSKKTEPPILEKKTKTKKKEKKKKKNKTTNKEISGAMSVFDTIIEENIMYENDDKEEYDKFLKNQQNHTKQIKEASLKIKNNFKSITEKKGTDNDIFGNKNINAFEQIIEEKIENKNPGIDRQAYKSSIDLAIEGYDKEKINETITKVMINQKDYSKNDKIESYEGEKYMGNLVKLIGEQAPIQPLLYQNSGKGSERIIKKSFVIDSGNIGGGTQLSTVTNLGLLNQWTKFKISMIDTINIDKLCDIYLRSVSVFNPKIIQIKSGSINTFTINDGGSGYTNGEAITCVGNGGDGAIFRVTGVNGTGGITGLSIINSGENYTAGNLPLIGQNSGKADGILTINQVTSGTDTNGMCFTVDIDEINLIYNSNNENIKDKIVINNNITSNISGSNYLNINYPTQAYYIGSINPSKLNAFTITLGDQNGTTNTIFNSDNDLNRIILSFEIVLRGEVNELF
jgi:hypothetical protein